MRGMINICILHIVLEPIIPKLSVHYSMQTQTANGKRDSEAYGKITENLQDAQVEVKTLLGETNITIDEFLNLSKDDIIALKQPIDQPLALTINNEPKFYVQPGKSKNNISVQVLKEIRGGTNDE